MASPSCGAILLKDAHMAFKPDVNVRDGGPCQYEMAPRVDDQLSKWRWTNGRDSSAHNDKYLNEPSFWRKTARRDHPARDRICDCWLLFEDGSVAVQFKLHL